ncbi:MAG: cobyric acid synthase [Bacteroidaceae bacterium]|nr:cobyric acid synthase [Bacteroidaceae bacterium]
MNQALNNLMLVGTGSDVGKSVLCTGLCRIFLQDGYRPAPFKAQNMALNSFATPDGFEIGRAQAVQAEACCLPAHTDMNPLLLKPNSEHTTQVVLNGKPIGNRSAYAYFRKEGREELRAAVNAAFDRLRSQYNPIVMEGAGSVSEINLRDSDLVNMPMARHADADVILVADIDRGGVFASCYGSVMLQTPEDRKRIKGIIINKFRGDIRLFEEGRKMIEELCGVPVLGVVPMFRDIVIDEEDSVALEKKQTQLNNQRVNVAVVLLRHISNFTDFNVLERDERVNLFYTNNVSDIEQADVVILPGTKATLDDLYELRRNGVAKAIVKAHHDGKQIIGICGGYQMLGQTVNDPDGIEGSVASLPGLGLLNIDTTMTADKTTEQVEFLFNGQRCVGYEIHQGCSTPTHASSSTTLPQIVQEQNCMGTYIHGFLDNKAVIEHILAPFGNQTSPSRLTPQESIEDFRNRQYNLLADHLRQYIDIDKLYSILTPNPPND